MPNDKRLIVQKKKIWLINTLLVSSAFSLAFILHPVTLVLSKLTRGKKKELENRIRTYEHLISLNFMCFCLGSY